MSIQKTITGAKRLLGFQAGVSCSGSLNIKTLEVNAALKYEDLKTILDALFEKYHRQN